MLMAYPWNFTVKDMFLAPDAELASIYTVGWIIWNITLIFPATYGMRRRHFRLSGYEK